MSEEQARLFELTRFEREARQLGYKAIAGIDEAGRGPLAGPVVAAACCIPKGIYFEGVNDSKLLSEAKRLELFKKIVEHPEIKFGIGIVSHEIIDQINIYQATIVAMQRAVEALSSPVDYLLVDGLKLPHTLPVLKIIKGDRLSQSIAAASIIAKQTRDKLMLEYHEQYPQYGFDRHKGYPTAMHRAAIAVHGLSPIHRKSFKCAVETNSNI